MNDTKNRRALIGRRLRAARERAHIGVVEAAREMGVQPLAVERWERGAALPSLVEFGHALELYGVMPCEVLFETNPMELPPDLAAELAKEAKRFSPGLRARVDCLLAMLARGKEPVWQVENPR